MTVVVFWLPRSGVQSQISIKSSSGSSALDAAAVSCVSRLRFAPATRIGDGEPIDSWQQIAFRWANNGSADATRATASQSPRGSGAPAQVAADARRDTLDDHANSVTVHVCVDENGRLKQDPTIVRSSGRASLDQAALSIAASGSAYYRPGSSSNAAPGSGCAQLSIDFDTK
jgi:TonB family protein